MPGEDATCSAVLDALGYVLFVRDGAGALRLAGDWPEWLARLWPAAAVRDAELPLAEASPFLENFLIDAEECWRADVGRLVESGPWIERDPSGTELRLQARALTADGQACLLIERLGEAFDSQVAVLQKARETVIALHRLDAEIQKKEILVHCLAEDLSGSLGNIVTSLRLIEIEKNSPNAVHLLSLAMQSAQALGNVIDKVLGLFPDELKGLYGGKGGVPAFANLHLAVRLSIDDVAPYFSEKGVRLGTPGAVEEELRILADGEHVRRLLGNLLRHALEHTPPGGEVAVRIADEADGPMLSIEFPQDAGYDESDGGFHPRSDASSEAFLRFRFCRMAVEICHGEMGFRSREGGGTCAWVRLPKWVAEG